MFHSLSIRLPVKKAPGESPQHQASKQKEGSKQKICYSNPLGDYNKETVHKIAPGQFPQHQAPQKIKSPPQHNNYIPLPPP